MIPTCRRNQDRSLAERTQSGAATVNLARLNPRLRIESTFPAPFDLIDDMDGQSLHHGCPRCGGSTTGLSAIGRLREYQWFL